jgi:adenylate cyclase class IV
MLEIEKRGFLTEEQYHDLLEFLEKNAEDLGEDNKEVVYYIYPDKLLKAVNNLSKGNAKISLKMNKIGQGSVFPETEVHFAKDDFEKMKFMLDKISHPDKVLTGTQKRKNFIYKGCELSIKWSEHWQYHFEIEIMVEDENQVEEAERQLELVADELKIKILTEEELRVFVKKLEESN